MHRRSWLKLASAALFGLAAPPARAQTLPLVALTTRLGRIVVVLETRRAPLSAGAFLDCATRHGFDGGAFTRVVRPDNDHGTPKISVIQGANRPGLTLKPIAHETTRQTGLRHRDGTVSLGRDAVGTATGGEFFICVGDQPGLDYGGPRNPDRQGFAAFGHVTEGMDIVREILAMPANGPSPDAYTRGQMLAPKLAILAATRLG